MIIDTELLSRVQFAFTISFHILFPAFSIGLATFLLIMEAAWLKTKNHLYLSICKYWTKIFALTFGMGVVSGIVMEFQLGTNWAGFTQAVGPVLGSLFAYEVMTAFFIEAGFLGVMIFGWEKVGSKLHFFATCLVVFGVTLSAFWILSANSWMQHPAGAIMKNGIFVVTNWWHVIFNPLVMPRWIHMMFAAYISTAFVIIGISAHYLLQRKHEAFAKKCMSFALWVILILVPLQIFVGDMIGLDIHQYQPLKTAAMEGIWQTQKGAPLLLFAVPDQEKQKNLYSIGIPHGAALINTHQLDGTLIGLKTVPEKDQPVVAMVFYSFRVMVGIGILMLFMAVIGLVLRIKQKLFTSLWYLKTSRLIAPLGFIAIITGWFTAESGRQPWVVYQMLRTDFAASKITVAHVWLTLVLLIIVYGVIFGIFYFRYLGKILKAGPVNYEQVDMPFAYLSSKAVEKN